VAGKAEADEDAGVVLAAAAAAVVVSGFGGRVGARVSRAPEGELASEMATGVGASEDVWRGRTCGEDIGDRFATGLLLAGAVTESVALGGAGHGRTAPEVSATDDASIECEGEGDKLFDGERFGERLGNEGGAEVPGV